jgi:hypothetical protein
MANLHPYPQTIPLETRWRMAREEMERRTSRTVDPGRPRFRRLRAALGY